MPSFKIYVNLKESTFTKKKQEAWKIIFGDADPHEALKIIARDWDIPMNDLISWFSYRLVFLKPEEQRRIINNLNNLIKNNKIQAVS